MYRRHVIGIVLTLTLVVAPGSFIVSTAQSSHDVTAEMVEQWMTDLSNWTRWGDDDELGSVNLITSEKRRQAIGLARSGTSVSLSHNYLTEPAEDATSPFGHEMLGIDRPGPFRSDRYTIAYHGYATRTWIPSAT